MSHSNDLDEAPTRRPPPMTDREAQQLAKRLWGRRGVAKKGKAARRLFPGGRIGGLTFDSKGFAVGLPGKTGRLIENDWKMEVAGWSTRLFPDDVNSWEAAFALALRREEAGTDYFYRPRGQKYVKWWSP